MEREVNQFRGREKTCSDFCFIQQNHWIQYSKNVSGFKHRTRAICGFNVLKCMNRRAAATAAIFKMTHPSGGNCLNIWALPNISFFSGFVILTFVYSSLASSSAALTCSQQLWLLSSKEWNKLSMKNTIFSSQAWVNYQDGISQKCFFPQAFVRSVLWFWTEGWITSDMFISTDQAVGFEQHVELLLFMCPLERSHEHLWLDFLFILSNKDLTDDWMIVIRGLGFLNLYLFYFVELTLKALWWSVGLLKSLKPVFSELTSRGRLNWLFL